jgi:hypothetical protein
MIVRSTTAAVAFIIIIVVKTLLRWPRGKRQRRDVWRAGHDFLRSLVHSYSQLYLKQLVKK